MKHEDNCGDTCRFGPWRLSVPDMDEIIRIGCIGSEVFFQDKD
jgi:Fe-S-cluster containining protein